MERVDQYSMLEPDGERIVPIVPPIHYDGSGDIQRLPPPGRVVPYVPVIALVPGIPPAGDVIQSPQTGASGEAGPPVYSHTYTDTTATQVQPADELPTWAVPAGIFLALLLFGGLFKK